VLQVVDEPFPVVEADESLFSLLGRSLLGKEQAHPEMVGAVVELIVDRQAVEGVVADKGVERAGRGLASMGWRRR